MNAQANARQFEAKDAKREGGTPLLVGLVGPSGSGKTYSALRLATGMQEVTGGDIYFIDTENNRAKHYADRFKFKHVDFQPPFGSLDYLAALEFCVKQGAKTIIVDSMSHEHSGPGGMVDLQETILHRMAGDDWKKRQAMQMLAWAEPKTKRRALIDGILRLNANFVFCFRAKNTSKPVKKDGKTEVEKMGFMPIAGEEFVFEQTLNCLLLPAANGVPTWHSEELGERTMIKLPEQFRWLERRNAPLDEKVGAGLARWAAGMEKSKKVEEPERAERQFAVADEDPPADEPPPKVSDADPIDAVLKRIEDAISLREVDAIDKETDTDRGFLTDEQVDRLDEALATKRAAIREKRRPAELQGEVEGAE